VLSSSHSILAFAVRHINNYRNLYDVLGVFVFVELPPKGRELRLAVRARLSDSLQAAAGLDVVPVSFASCLLVWVKMFVGLHLLGVVVILFTCPRQLVSICKHQILLSAFSLACS